MRSTIFCSINYNGPSITDIQFYKPSICFVLVSGEVPEHPVLSLVSKHTFEKRLIEKYLAEHGTDPITGEPLSDDMLIDIKSKKG